MIAPAPDPNAGAAVANWTEPPSAPRRGAATAGPLEYRASSSATPPSACPSPHGQGKGAIMAARLDGKVALVSGGARGIGAATARLFAAEGAVVLIGATHDRDGEATAATIEGCVYQHLDVRAEDDWRRASEDLVALHGTIDVLVNNAGVFMARPLTEVSLADYREVIDVNQVGVFLGMRAVAPTMMAAGSGSIVNISSVDGLRGFPRGIAYGASKWAVRGMTKVAARELAPFGVRVNSIHPGAVDTRMLREVPPFVEGGMEGVASTVPMGRIGDADEVAKLALFLACNESAYCTGAEFVIDGGMTV